VILSDAEDAEVSVSAGLLSVDLRRHNQLRRSIPGGGTYAAQCRSLLDLSTFLTASAGRAEVDDLHWNQKRL